MVVKMLFVAEPAIRTGETLRGTLQVVATKPVPAQSLKVSFVGVEYASVVTCGKLRKANSIKYQDEKKVLCKDIHASRVNRMIRHGDNTFKEGSYQVDFSIHVPNDVPASGVLANSQGCAKIEYSLKAVLKGLEDYQDYCCSQVVQVQAGPSLLEVKPRKSTPRCHTVRSSLLGKGQVFTGAISHNTVVMPGQQLEVGLAVANESTSAMDNIQVRLRERIHWSARGHSKTVWNDLVTMSVSDTPPKSDVVRLMEKLQDRKRQEKKLELIGKQLETGGNLILFRLPPVPKHAHTTYVGTRITVTHELIITLESTGWKKNPEVRLPVRVCATQIAPVLQVAPANKKEEQVHPVSACRIIVAQA